VNVTNSSTALIAAAAAGTVERTTILRNTGSVTAYLGFGATATTSMFPLGAGESLRTGFTGAINGITASGTATVFVLSEGR